MTQLCLTDANPDVVPPEEKLTAPPAVTSTESVEISTESAEENKAEQESLSPVPSCWLVVAKNRRVNRDWEVLLLRASENARRCYEDLCTTPMVRKPGRVFPLKGILYWRGVAISASQQLSG